MMTRQRTTAGAWLALVLLLSACSHRLTVASDLGIQSAPDWVNRGTNVLASHGERFFYGVGSSPALGDQSLQVDTADERARAEVARVLGTYLKVASHDYLSATAAGGPPTGEGAVSRSIRAVTRMNLVGTKIIGRWRDPHTGIIYALAQLDMAHVQQTLHAVQAMNPSFGQYLKANGTNIFDRVAAQTSR